MIVYLEQVFIKNLWYQIQVWILNVEKFIFGVVLRGLHNVKEIENKINVELVFLVLTSRYNE